MAFTIAAPTVVTGLSYQAWLNSTGGAGAHVNMLQYVGRFSTVIPSLGPSLGARSDLSSGPQTTAATFVPSTSVATPPFAIQFGMVFYDPITNTLLIDTVSKQGPEL